MNYQETLDYLFNALPMFQRIGAAAFKKDLTPTIKLCEYLGNPEQQFRSIHIAGTNGKGSTSHALASVLQEEGYKVGLYTSPHLKSFTERIKINGQEIPQGEVVRFVEAHRAFIDELKPSFFEMTVALAFDHFAREKVDIAVVEVGMGGRFDSTNVLAPLLSVITNIGLDHVQFLGSTFAEIAFEKAGIIKSNTPVVIGETHDDTARVFTTIASEKSAPIWFADQAVKVEAKLAARNDSVRGYTVYCDGRSDVLQLDLLGNYQIKNMPAIYLSCRILPELGISLSAKSIENGLRKIVPNTGLKGRWQQINNNPLTICDTGHNTDAFQVIIPQLMQLPHDKLCIVLGMVNDKDVTGVLALLPQEASYVFCQANIPRALPAGELAGLAGKFGLEGQVIADVNEAVDFAVSTHGQNDLVFVGGSTFVVAEIRNL